MLTAYGVFQGMRAAAEATWGAPTLAGRTVGVAGVGKVGHHLVEHLLEDGAQVVISDVYAPAVARILEAHPEVRAVADTDALVAEPIDVYSPCALGDALHPTRSWRRCGPGSCAGPRTTSSPTPAWRSSWPTPASSTRPTTS